MKKSYLISLAVASLLLGGCHSTTQNKTVKRVPHHTSSYLTSEDDKLIKDIAKGKKDLSDVHLNH